MTMRSTLLREGFAEAVQIGLDPPHHYRIEVARGNRHTAGEALRVFSWRLLRWQQTPSSRST